jgi:hypothetical protein
MAPSYKEDDDQDRQFDFDWDRDALPDYLKPFLSEDGTDAPAAPPASTAQAAGPPSEDTGDLPDWLREDDAGGVQPFRFDVSAASTPPAGGFPPADLFGSGSGGPPPGLFTGLGTPAPGGIFPSAGPGGSQPIDHDFGDLQPFTFGDTAPGGDFDFNSSRLPDWLGRQDSPPAEPAPAPIAAAPAPPTPTPQASPEPSADPAALPDWLRDGAPATAAAPADPSAARPPARRITSPIGPGDLPDGAETPAPAPAAPPPTPAAGGFDFGDTQPFAFGEAGAPGAPSAPADSGAPASFDIGASVAPPAAPTPEIAPPAAPDDSFDFGGLQPFDFGALNAPPAATPGGASAPPAPESSDFGGLQPFDFGATAGATPDAGPGAPFNFEAFGAPPAASQDATPGAPGAEESPAPAGADQAFDFGGLQPFDFAALDAPPATTPGGPSAPPAGADSFDFGGLQPFDFGAATSARAGAAPPGGDLDFSQVQPFDFGADAADAGGADATAPTPQGPFSFGDPQPFDFAALNAETPAAPAAPEESFDFGGLQPFDFGATTGAASAATPSGPSAPPADSFDFGGLQPFDFGATAGATPDTGAGAPFNFEAFGAPPAPVPAGADQPFDFAGMEPFDFGAAPVGAEGDDAAEIDDFIGFLSIGGPPLEAGAESSAPDAGFDFGAGVEPFSLESLDLSVTAAGPAPSDFNAPGAPAWGSAAGGPDATGGPGPADTAGFTGEEFNFEPFAFDGGGAAPAAFGAPAPSAFAAGAPAGAVPPGLENLPDLQPFSFDNLETSVGVGADAGPDFGRRATDRPQSPRPASPYSLDDEVSDAGDVHDFSWQRAAAAPRPAPAPAEPAESETSIFAKARRRKEELDATLRQEAEARGEVYQPPAPGDSITAQDADELGYWPIPADDSAVAVAPAQPASAAPAAPLAAGAQDSPQEQTLEIEASGETAPAPVPTAPPAGDPRWSSAAPEAQAPEAPAAPGAGSDDDLAGIPMFDLSALDLEPREQTTLAGQEPPPQAPAQAESLAAGGPTDTLGQDAGAASYAEQEQDLGGVPELRLSGNEPTMLLDTADLEPFTFDAGAYEAAAAEEAGVEAEMSAPAEDAFAMPDAAPGDLFQFTAPAEAAAAPAEPLTFDAPMAAGPAPAAPDAEGVDSDIQPFDFSEFDAEGVGGLEPFDLEAETDTAGVPAFDFGAVGADHLGARGDDFSLADLESVQPFDFTEDLGAPAPAPSEFGRGSAQTAEAPYPALDAEAQAAPEQWGSGPGSPEDSGAETEAGAFDSAWPEAGAAGGSAWAPAEPPAGHAAEAAEAGAGAAWAPEAPEPAAREQAPPAAATPAPVLAARAPEAPPAPAPALPAGPALGGVEDLVQHVASNPTDAAARLALAIGYEQRDDYSHAAEQYKALIKGRQVPANVLAIVTGNLRELVDDQPDNAAFHRLLGDAYMKQGAHQMAIAEYNWLLTQGAK